MKVVVVGGGFGGVRTAVKLAGKPGFEVTLISDKPYFEYHAALYRAATGRSPLEVAIPLRDFFATKKNVQVLKDKITQVHPAHQYVEGAEGSRYPYDALVLAVGSQTQYFGIKGLEQFSYGIKSVDEALELKRHLHSELAEKPHGRTNYVVVGGGATGVELAAELTAYVKKIRRRHHLASKPFRVLLVEAAESLMPNLPVSFTTRIRKQLHQLGVDVRLGVTVSGETKDKLEIPGVDIKSHSVIWTAGVINNPLFARHPDIFDLDRGQKVRVDRHLRAASNIYVIGDSALSEYSGMAQTAVHQGELVAKNLMRKAQERELLSYTPKPPIYAIPVGWRWSAVLIGNAKFYGYLGWLVRRLADLRLYLKFLPPLKALSVWRYAYKLEEACPDCR